MLLILLFIFFIFFLVDFRVTFILTLISSTLLMHFVSRIDFLENFYIELSIVCIFVFFLFKNKLVVGIRRFPLYIAIVILLTSQLLTFLFHPIFPGAIFRNVIYYIDIYILFCLYVNNRFKTMHVFTISALLYGMIVGGYCLFETTTGDNPYIAIMNSTGLYSRDVLVEEVRFGLKRSQSFFSMHTTSAGVLMLLSLFLMSQFVNTKKNNRYLYFIVAVVCGVGVFLSGARSAMLGYTIGVLSFIQFKKIKVIFIVFAIGLVIMQFASEYFSDVFSAFVNTEEVGGSSTDMRSEQMAISAALMANSPLFGNGMQYTWGVAAKTGLLGAESLWFPIMIEQGVVGLLSCIFFFVVCFRYAFIRRHKNICFLVLGFLVFNTMSAIPMIPFFFIFIYEFMIINAYSIRQEIYDRRKI